MLLVRLVLVLQHILADTGQHNQIVKSGTLMGAVVGLQDILVLDLMVTSIIVNHNHDVLMKQQIVEVLETKVLVNHMDVLGIIIHKTVRLLMSPLVQAHMVVILIMIIVIIIMMEEEMVLRACL